jgi:hypothetical protein
VPPHNDIYPNQYDLNIDLKSIGYLYHQALIYVLMHSLQAILLVSLFDILTNDTAKKGNLRVWI